MAPAKFGDLGKNANDLFDKGFEYGNVKVELKTHSSDGIALLLKGAHDNNTAAIASSLEAKYNCDKIGEIKKTWNANKANLDVEIANSSLLKGGKITFTGCLNPNGGFIPGKLKTNWSNDKMNVNFNSSISATPKLDFDAVLAHNNFNLGFACGFNMKNSALESKQVAFGIQQGSVNCVVKSALANDVSFVAFNKVNNDLSVGIRADYGKSMNLGLAAKCTHNADCTKNIKVNHNGQMGFSCSTKLDSGCELTTSAMINLPNLSNGGHKVGAMFKFDL